MNSKNVTPKRVIKIGRLTIAIYDDNPPWYEIHYRNRGVMIQFRPWDYDTWKGPF